MIKGTTHTIETKHRIGQKVKQNYAERPELLEAVRQNAFRPGHKTWNAGIKGMHMSPETEFKTGGLLADKHPCWKGGVNKPTKEGVYIYAGANKRVKRSRRVYELAHGSIPHGYVIFHKDGNNLNDDIHNLEAISRADLIRRNNETQGL